MFTKFGILLCTADLSCERYIDQSTPQDAREKLFKLCYFIFMDISQKLSDTLCENIPRTVKDTFSVSNKCFLELRVGRKLGKIHNQQMQDYCP